MSATSEELASQAEQLQTAFSYFRISAGSAGQAAAPAKARAGLREAIMANAPQMSEAKPAKRNGKGGGFDLDLDDGHDELDGDFTRRGAA